MAAKSSTNEPASFRWMARRRPLWIAVTCAVLSAAGLVAYLVRDPATPLELPELQLDGVDPAVIRTIEEAMDAVRESPASASAWGRLGMTLFAHDFLEDACPCFRRAAESEPTEPLWPYLDALSRVATDPEGAVPELERTVKLCGDSPLAPRLRLAEVLFELGRVDEATSHFHRVLDRESGNARAHLGLARVTLQSGDLEASQAHLEHAEVSPRARGASNQLLVQIHARLGNLEIAKQKQAEATASSSPGWPDPYFEQVRRLRKGKKTALVRADILIGKGRFKEAVQVLDGLTRNYPNSPWAWILTGRAHLKLRQFDAAEQALERALRLQPDSVEARFRLGVSLSFRKRFRDAAECFRKAIEGKPDFARAYFNLGYCLNQLSELEDAIAAFRSAIRHEPDNVSGLGYLGHLLTRTGKFEEADRFLSAAAELDPKNAWIQRQIAELEARVAGGR
jgi:tetratricopeptide (TPR) repeat protein